MAGDNMIRTQFVSAIVPSEVSQKCDEAFGEALHCRTKLAQAVRPERQASPARAAKLKADTTTRLTIIE